MAATSRGVSTPAVAAATRAGVTFRIHSYHHDPTAPSYGLEAAERLGLEPARVLKTLVAEVDGRLTVAVIPVTLSLDLKALAGAVGGKKAAMAHPELAARVTGYVVGGISPLGQKKQLPTVIDAGAVAGTATVFVSAGRRGLEMELATGDLVDLTAGLVADIAR
jgi:Cys-tRNA(Pro)/Cys-tRNA(Cys) deacylase